MSAPALAPRGPVVRIGGAEYPVLLPRVGDPRLHLAGVIVSLQVLGQTAFAFDLSITQILVSLTTCAVLEVAIALRRQHVLMWPASALLTGNGVAFVLRVPGTEHGDWWSLHGWWIFSGTAALALLSKHLVVFRGRHVFNPSNLGLVVCFLLLGSGRADPLAFWWGPLSAWLVLALALIVGGGLAILARLGLLGIAVGFWLTFAAGVGVLAASGHQMTAAWHLGPIDRWELWRVLVTSPEILVFLFFMITDPRTTPATTGGRRAYGVAIGLLATLLIAPWTSEFSAKVAVLVALALVCAARPALAILVASAHGGRLLDAQRRLLTGRRRYGALATGCVVAGALVVVAGLPSRPLAATTPVATERPLPPVTTSVAAGVQPLGRATARTIAAALVRGLDDAAVTLRTRNAPRAQRTATGAWLADLWRRIDDARGSEIAAPVYELDGIRLRLEPGDGQGPPVVLASVTGMRRTPFFAGSPARLMREGEPERIALTFELVAQNGRYLVSALRDAPRRQPVQSVRATFTLTDVASRVGIDFRQESFRFGVTGDETAMMGGGLCWVDYDADGWLDLFAVNGYAETDIPGWQARGELPSSRLYRNVGGRFEDVTTRTGTGLRVRGSGCVAADFDGNGTTDLYVTTAGYDAARDAFDALLWNGGDGTFTEGAWAAGLRAFGWHTGAAAADVNGDGRLDLFVAGYTDPNGAVPGSGAGFPANHRAARDLLYLNDRTTDGRVRFREVGREAGLEPRGLDHGLGALFSDLDGDGRLDLYVANDLDPNRLYRNVARPRDPLGLAFRLVEQGAAAGVADANAGMGVAAGDYTADGKPDLFVTNSRGQLHAAFSSRNGASFGDARGAFARALGQRSTGWGVTWADLDLDGTLELAIANGAIPITKLEADAERIQVITTKDGANPLSAGAIAPRNGRGLAAADYDNDGDLDLAVGAIGGRLQLLRNDGATGHWLEVAGLEPGARITAVLPNGTTLVRTLHAGSSYLSSEDPRVHLGLGAATRVEELVVRHPGGAVMRLRDLRTDRLIVVRPPR